MLLHHAQTKIKQPLCVCTRELSDGWARVDCASRASKKAPLGLFCPPDCTVGRCCSNPPAFVSFTHIQNKKLQRNSYVEAFLVGAGGFEPPKLKSSRFTVCPHWPLGNTPRFCSRPCRTTRLFYQTKADLSTVFSHFFSFFFRGQKSGAAWRKFSASAAPFCERFMERGVSPAQGSRCFRRS